MKRKRYSTEQIVAVINQHELGTPAVDIIRKLGIAEQTFSIKLGPTALYSPQLCKTSNIGINVSK